MPATTTTYFVMKSGTQYSMKSVLLQDPPLAVWQACKNIIFAKEGTQMGECAVWVI